MEDRDPINAKISLNVIPRLREVSHRVGALMVMAWCQLVIMVLVVGLLVLVLVRVL